MTMRFGKKKNKQTIPFSWANGHDEPICGQKNKFSNM